MYLEFPKAVYRDGDTARESRVVKNADEEADAALQGFQALPAHPPPEPMQVGSPEHLPYPKMLYRDGKADGETCVVPNAEKEAEKAAEGFYALGSGPSDDAGTTEADDAPKGRRWRKKAD